MAIILRWLSSCLHSTELAKYAKTKLVLNIGNSELRCMFKVIIKYGKFKLLFPRGLHGIVLKCVQREHAYLSSFNQSNCFFVVSSLPFRCWCATSMFKISTTSIHALWLFGFIESVLWFHGVITRAIYLMRNTTGSFTCDWDFSAWDPLRGFITSGHLGLGGSDFLITLKLLGR